MAKTISTFVKNVVLLLNGDNAEEIGIKIQKRGSAILSAQIAAKEAIALSLEDTVDSCKEELANARLNSGQLITDNQRYVQRLLDAHYNLMVSEESLEGHLGDVSFLKEQLAIINT